MIVRCTCFFYAFLVISGLLLLPGCQSAYGPDTDAIIRINQQMCTQFRQEQVLELTAHFADSVNVIIPGSPMWQGKPVLQAYWSRYLNPIHLSIQHIRFFAVEDILEGNTDLPPSLLALLPNMEPLQNRTPPVLYQWSDWNLQYEAEDGVIRSESHPTLLQWTDDADSGWRITWMAQL